LGESSAIRQIYELQSWAHHLFIEQFKRIRHYTINLPAQRLLADPAAVRSAQSLLNRETPTRKRSAGKRPLPPDFQRKLAEMNLQLNFLYRRLSVAMTNQKPLALWNINGQGDLSAEWLID
jgi:hypothetical protein